MYIKSKIDLLGFITSICIISVGFSTWTITNSESLKGFITVDDVKQESIDYKDTAYSISGSEYGFDFFIFENEYQYTASSMGYKIKINPLKLKNEFEGNDVSIGLGLGYSSGNIDLFSPSNSYFISPKKAKISLDNAANRFIFSEDLEYSYEDINKLRSHYLVANALLYSDENPSLYSISKDFQTDESKYLEFTISFDFEIIEIPSTFRTIKFFFYSSLEEV